MQGSSAENSQGIRRVLLAGDHTMFREGLAELLASYGAMEIVGSTFNGSDAAYPAEEVKPDVVIMQVQMPLENARETLTRMRVVSPL